MKSQKLSEAYICEKKRNVYLLLIFFIEQSKLWNFKKKKITVEKENYVNTGFKNTKIEFNIRY